MINFSQEQIFLFFLVIGVIIGIIFDFFRMLRKSFKTTDTVTFVEDIIFVIISGFLIILGIQKLNSGIVRMYLFIGLFTGFLIYSLTISNICGIIIHRFIKVCKFIFKIPISIIKKVLKIFQNVKKM